MDEDSVRCSCSEGAQYAYPYNICVGILERPALTKDSTVFARFTSTSRLLGMRSRGGFMKLAPALLMAILLVVCAYAQTEQPNATPPSNAPASQNDPSADQTQT